MKSTDVITPTAIKFPVAKDGTRNNIPLNATGSNLASITEGFPDITMQSIDDGGLPPYGEDFNGLFYLATDYKAYLQDGGYITFDETVSNLISGYPQGAILDYYDENTNSYTKVVSLIDDNTYNFNTTPAYIDNTYWRDVNFGGANLSLTNLNASGIDYINNSKALETGGVGNNADIYADVQKYAHSTYDRTKFTSFLVGSPTITAEGIASGFASSPTTNIKVTTVPTSNNYFVTGEFKTPAVLDTTIPFSAGVTVSGSLQLLFSLRHNGNNNHIQLLVRNSGGTNTTIENAAITMAANTSYKYVVVVNGANVSFYINNQLVGTANDFCELLPEFFIIGADRGNQNPFSGTIDLKWFSINENGVLFNGNKTGADTYTIGGNTVSIPYTLSKTGSKIADASARANVTALYNQQGYAPYYTIDEVNADYTLPMGELYGLIRKSVLTEIAPDWDKGVALLPNTDYTASESGWLRAYGWTSQNAIQLTINSKIVAYSEAKGSEDTSGFGCMEFVEAGMPYILTALTGAIQEFEFIPCKGGI